MRLLTNDPPIVFRTIAEAQEFAATLNEDAETGEEFRVVPDPKGSGRAIVQCWFDGKHDYTC